MNLMKIRQNRQLRQVSILTNFSKIHQIVNRPKLILLMTNLTKICQNCQFRQADSL